MYYIGIDFSLNSPAACIQDPSGSYTFISFFNYGERYWLDDKTPKAFSLHRDLSNSSTIEAVPYSRRINSVTFVERERQKLIDGNNIANLIIDHIKDIHSDNKVKIALEGFSYGSSGNSFIDIIQYNTFLRSMLLHTYDIDYVYIMQPSHVKKLAGKGNANKHYMVKAFQDNVLNDPDLEKTKLWNWVKDKDYSEKIPKPIDDLIDAYFILNTIKLYSNES